MRHEGWRGGRPRRTRRAGLVVLLVAGAIGAAPGAPATGRHEAAAGAGATAAGTGRLRAAPGPTVPPDLVDRYLARRPSLGPVTVIDVAGEPPDRMLLATTLQGAVNRTQARIYLVGARPAAQDEYWLDQYEADGLITVHARVGLDAALATFAPELPGYVIADPAEPWTIDTATTAAGATGGVVATPTTLATVAAAGLAELDDQRGRWTDAASAYEAAADEYRSQLAYPGVAIQQPDHHAPRDLYVQQGILTVFTRPSLADFDRVYDLIETLPSGNPVYGYVSDTGDEEVTAVVRLARTGRFLIPTDTTSNLSFHLAVGGQARARPSATAPVVEPCRADRVNVAIAMSDGDNLVIPEGYYPMANRWNSPRRGELPVGWGITPATAVLMPAIWDHYVAGTAPGDELVDIMGLGYGLPSLMPGGGAAFLAASMRLRAALGVRTTWSLDALITDPAAGGWTAWARAAAATGAPPEGILLNYARWPGPAWYRTVGGIGVLSARRSSYDDGPAEIAAQIQALVDGPAEDRPLVAFFPATVWNASYDQLADAMAPLADQGVRFLTPAEAFACLPEAPPIIPTTEPASTPTTSAPVPAGGAGPVAGRPTYVG